MRQRSQRKVTVRLERREAMCAVCVSLSQHSLLPPMTTTATTATAAATTGTQSALSQPILYTDNTSFVQAPLRAAFNLHECPRLAQRALTLLN